MQIIRNFGENDFEKQNELPQHTQMQPEGNQLNAKELSFLLKSKLQKDKEPFDLRGKVMLHKRITKTFVANTPEQSCDKVKKNEPVRQRDKKVTQTRGESPLMSDLNSYIMLKDHDVVQNPKLGPQIGMNPPPSGDDLMTKLYKVYHQQ